MDIINEKDVDFTKFSLLSSQGSLGRVYTDGNKCFKRLCLYSPEDKARIYKKFLDMGDIKIPGVILPEEIIVDNNKKMIGYTMEYFKNSQSLYNKFCSSRYVDVNSILQATKKSSEILREIHKNKIVLCDFSFDNILINKNDEIRFCDLDDCKYGKYEHGIISRLTYLFYLVTLEDTPVFNKNLDRQSLLLSLINTIYHGMITDINEYDQLSDKIKTLHNMRDLVCKMLHSSEEQIPYLDELICDDDHFIIDRDKQVCRAKAKEGDYKIYY